MLIWKILVVTDIVFNVFASLVIGMAVSKVYKQNKKKAVKPTYQKYGSK